MPVILPTEKRIATERNARFLVAFGKPKSGKTTAISMLDDCLLIDINNGSDYVDGLVVKAGNLRELKAIAVAIKEAGCPYEKIALDTATDLEDMVAELAIFKYKQTPMGKNYGKLPGEDDVRKLSNGAGYLYLREAFKDALNWFKPLCKYFILLGHCSDRLINKDGKELTEMEIDLSGKLFSSPLREDKHPSFTIFNSSKYNELFWKDFRFGSGDIIIFVQKMFNLNYFEALSKIATDFNIKDLFISPKDVNKSSKQPKIYNKSDIKKESIVIKIKSRKFNTYDFWFWGQFGITSKCLKKYKVIPITHYFINNKPIKASKLSYAYPEKKDGNITYKIYQPLSKAKWYNNHNHSVVQGWRQLPNKGKDLIITSSLKDAMSIICTTNYYAIAPQAESVLLKPHIFEMLNKRFDNVYINYDNDCNKAENWGQLNAMKIIEKYDFIKNIMIPSEYKSKDYSDLVMHSGKDFASELLKKLINEAKS